MTMHSLRDATHYAATRFAKFTVAAMLAMAVLIFWYHLIH